jgi:hypothetical protein
MAEAGRTLALAFCRTKSGRIGAAESAFVLATLGALGAPLGEVAVQTLRSSPSTVEGVQRAGVERLSLTDGLVRFPLLVNC